MVVHSNSSDETFANLPGEVSTNLVARVESKDRPARALDASPVHVPSDELADKPGNSRKQDRVVPFKPIGLGRPMTISLSSLYVGRKSGGGASASGQLLVMSTAKDPVDYAPSVVAMNAWQQVAPGERVSLDAGKLGSRILYYSPSQSERSISLSVQLNYDYFDKALWDSWTEAATKSAALPAFLGGLVSGGPAGAATNQAIVTVAGAAAKLVVSAIDRAIDGGASTVMSWNVPVASPGQPPIKPGWMLLTPDGLKVDVQVKRKNDQGFWEAVDEAVFGSEPPSKEAFDVDGLRFYVDPEDETLRHREGGTWPDGTNFHKDERVAGPFPFALVKIDGTENRKLKKWKPAAMSAELASRFLGDSGTSLPDLAVDVFDAYANATLVSQARELADEIKDASKAERKMLEQQRAAVIESITDDNLRDLVLGKHEETGDETNGDAPTGS